ncbi:Short-chain dehydrogenase [Candidatus Sulfotelmatobacter kueseliae]|uniref:Short-chain dehydrogenase n=1 Tax=Candidatus Sulfotelmatobacter kueseliae TaxID=2042962 RepID=A0A2U3KUD3_9BACT|nr:Short-chain dehydrogenase [Candidatus Sulfotelmatobacter kueseliae]
MPASTVLITGASGGIGYELAKLFARDHHNLVLVARSGDKLAQVAAELQPQGVSVKTIALDLAAPPAAKFLFDQLQREGLAVDILVNNAGFGAFGEFATMPEEEILGQISLNITALTELTRRFLPPMLARRSGRIMNVASTAAFQPGPLMAVYYATKAYVLSFSEAIANELRGSGVTATCFCPGATHTGFARRAGTENSRLFKQLGAMSAEKVALDGYRAVMEGRTTAISGAHNWIVAQSTRFAPRRMVTAVSRWVAEKVE